jgi:hypothetical protein
MSEIKLYEGSSPATPPAGVVTIYAKIDGKLYWKTDEGVETAFYPSGAGTGDLNSDGSVPLQANWNMGAFTITVGRISLTQPVGLPPIEVVSTTRCPNLNADLLDSEEGSHYLNYANFVGTNDADLLGGEPPSFYENIELASQVEAEAGTDNVKTMTALRVAQAIAAQTRGYITANFQTGTSYTLGLPDAGCIIEMDNALDNIVYIPDNSVVAFPVNTRIDITQRGIGSTSVQMVGTDTLTGNATVAGTNGAVSLWKRATTEWVVFGGAA